MKKNIIVLQSQINGNKKQTFGKEKKKKCVICDEPDGCTEVREAAACRNNPKNKGNKINKENEAK